METSINDYISHNLQNNYVSDVVIVEKNKFKYEFKNKIYIH